MPGIYRKRVNWVLDADIQGFFDAMSHKWVLRFLRHRIADKRILRLIAKWLHVGIRTGTGSPQQAGNATRSGGLTDPGEHLACVP